MISFLNCRRIPKKINLGTVTLRHLTWHSSLLANLHYTSQWENSVRISSQIPLKSYYIVIKTREDLLGHVIMVTLDVKRKKKIGWLWMEYFDHGSARAALTWSQTTSTSAPHHHHITCTYNNNNINYTPYKHCHQVMLTESQE